MRKQVLFFAILWVIYAFYCNVKDICILHCKHVNYYKSSFYLYAKPRNIVIKPCFIYNTWADIGNLLGFYKLLQINLFFLLSHLFFIYIKYIDLILDKTTLIYVTSYPSNVYFSIYKKPFLLKKKAYLQSQTLLMFFYISRKTFYQLKFA